VHAKRISLEDRARAFIMLQESEHLELAKSARLVGNFANEKELFFMMGKFSPQLKELPGSVDMSGGSQPRELGTERPTTMKIPAMTAAHGNDDDLRAAQSLIEREIVRPELLPSETEALREVLFSLRERNVQRVSSVWRDAFDEVRTGNDGLRQARAHLENYFGRPA
jgi:hypothetical protein